MHIWTFLDNENEFEEYSDELNDETNGGKSYFAIYSKNGHVFLAI